MAKRQCLRESEIERRLKAGIRELGGRCDKWVSPGCAGVPDRIAFLPGGRVYFIELKTHDGKLSTLQKAYIRELGKLGIRVHVLYGTKGVEVFLTELQGAKEVEALWLELQREMGVSPDAI